VPLGGVGEIGLNCLVLEYGGQAIAVDCGLMFPDAGMLGVDSVVPDFEYFRLLGKRFVGFVVTHGHEDHIGALPHALKEFEVPVYAPPMASGLLRARLREHGLAGKVALHTYRPRERWELGPFAIDPIHVTHSTVDSMGLAVTTPLGVVVHTGDFKIDYTPIDGAAPDLRTFAEYGSRGVLLLLSDSTNADRAGTTPSERQVRPGLEAVFRETKGRLFLSTFSSHIHRIQQVLDLARLSDRRVVVAGRSLLNSVKIATDLGYLKAPAGLFSDVTDFGELPAERVAVLAAGCQGEPLSALTRIAMGGHRHIRMEEGDSVVLSSRLIPGNERAIGNLINHICRRGAEVAYARNAPVHVSGHASRDELALMLNLVRPRYFVPVHGEYRHLTRHLALARAAGLSADATWVLEDGQVLEIDAAGARRGESVSAGRVFVDGKGIGDVGDVVLRDRRHLARDGLLLVVVAVDRHSGKLIGEPDFLARGLFDASKARPHFDAARRVVAEVLDRAPPESCTDSAEIKEEIRKALGRYMGKALDRRPVVVPVVMEM